MSLRKSKNCGSRTSRAHPKRLSGELDRLSVATEFYPGETKFEVSESENVPRYLSASLGSRNRWRRACDTHSLFLSFHTILETATSIIGYR